MQRSKERNRLSEPLAQEDEVQDSASVTSPPVKRSGFVSVLRNRSFLSLWVAQVTSQTAQNSLWFALIYMVARVTGSNPAGVGFTIILVQLPTVLFSGVSGVFVDRVSKRAILIGTNVIRVAGVLCYLLLQDNVGGLYLVTFVVAVVSQPFAPAEGSTIPLLVTQDELITANSLFQTTFMASQAVGFALAPIAIQLFGISTTLIMLAALFAVAAVVLIPLPAVTRRHTAAGAISWSQLVSTVRRDLVEAFHFIKDDHALAFALFQISLAPTLLLLLAEVGPDYVTHTLHLGQTSTALFLLLAPAGLGLGVGIFVLGQWGHGLRKERLVMVSLIALGVTVIGLAAVPLEASFWQRLHQIGLPIPAGVGFTVTMFPVTFLMGIEAAFINAPAQTIVQERAAPKIRGRVLALQQTLTAGLAIPPLIVVGGVATLLSTPTTLTLMGLTIICIGLAIVYYS